MNVIWTAGTVHGDHATIKIKLKVFPISILHVINYFAWIFWHKNTIF